MLTLNNNQLDVNEKDLPPQDVGAADGAEGPEEDSGSRSNKELHNQKEQNKIDNFKQKL